ncbi:hypothetical protein [Paenibacillus eucommiae]|uniref:Membrane protein YdjX (TVP38/TMEM64 family) n=1 Tax=Paenibacillus eucommiae TaxID=1355755 RepID=A0ABS4IQX7_9BACL|nr:hypothetical protein [Paenibacillus eucommiae]MBP1989974.1 putative membrane protein YdjX (TVP38/TMEM64 family) [Paenibacillus eucommiae]
MSVYAYYIVFFVILLCGTIATIMIGNSKANKEGNPEYDQKTKGYWSRLTWFYVVAIVLGFAALGFYLYMK